jgi:hypothetical protein
MNSDKEVLHALIQQVLELNLGEQGAREGVLYGDKNAGESLVERGIATRFVSGRLRLTKPALLQILKVAIDDATTALLVKDPPAEPWPQPPYPDAPEERLILLTTGPALRGK